LTRLSQTATTQVDTWTYTFQRWMTTNREVALRLTAHGVVLVAITATLGLSHVRLTDVRLPSLGVPSASPPVVRVVEEISPVSSDSESYLQKPIVPRTASAINVRAAPGDVAALAPREDLMTPVTRVTLPEEKPAEPVAAPVVPTLDSLTQSYVAQAGDTLLGIAYKFDIALGALVMANPSLKESLTTIFHPGDVFIIPPPGGILHHVKEGDTLASLAEKYSVKVEDIVSYGPNALQADSQLAAGQRVFVPEGRVALDFPAPRPQTNTLASVLQPRTTTTTTTTQAARPANTNPAPASAAPAAAPIAATGTLRTPLYGYVITQYFWAYHNGVDLAAPIGTPVYAADAGRVIYSGWDNTGYGYMVLIDHGNGYRTRYAHLSWIFPSYGAYVAKGEQIGKVGSTGRSTGPHLHFEVIVNGIARNPFSYIR
jgi:murein DD-endopeptidase MepM/ murein hydrolase activator NlpD